MGWHHPGQILEVNRLVWLVDITSTLSISLIADNQMYIQPAYITTTLAFLGPLALSWQGLATAENINWPSLKCPEDYKDTLPTPTYGSDHGVFVVCTEELINAPMARVYDALLDYSRYPIWNSFVIDVKLPSEELSETPTDVYVGMPMVLVTVGLLEGINSTSNEMITLLDDNGENGFMMNAWGVDDGLSGTIIAAEHPNILVDLGNDVTRYLSYETYYSSLLAPTVLLMREKLQTQFSQQGRDLKNYLEGL
ncbi:hypothetical protein SLS62_005544 [Diatrype stigma]|uniref:START domain-containing protein n=1 Tax=Diatrype stigma TaxID=117547 RepID=A0AAN9URB7_9PEZI